jgi:DNA-binding response OmpR family regulator
LWMRHKLGICDPVDNITGVTLRMLVVRGDDSAVEALARSLGRNGHIVDHADTGSQALRTYHCADFVLLDLDVPDHGSPQACGEIRAVGDAPITVPAGRPAELGQILPLRPTRDVSHGKLHIDFGKREVRLGERLIDLTVTEFDLLSLLARQPETVFSRKEIMASIWHADLANYSRTIDTHVYNLRRKLDSSDWIVTVRGIGFRLGRGLPDSIPPLRDSHIEISA